MTPLNKPASNPKKSNRKGIDLTEKSKTPSENELLVQERIDYTRRLFELGASIANEIRHKGAMSDIGFFNEYAVVKAPFLDNTGKLLAKTYAPRSVEFQERDRLAVMPLLKDDIEWIKDVPYFGELAQGKRDVAAVFRERPLPTMLMIEAFEVEDWIKGILFLHELRHATIYDKGLYKDAGEEKHWLEEADVWMYEFELIEGLKGQAWRDAVDYIKGHKDTFVDEKTLRMRGKSDEAFFEILSRNDLVGVGEQTHRSKTLLGTIASMQALYEHASDMDGRERARWDLRGALKRLQV